MSETLNQSPSLPLAKYLASPDKKTRDKAVKALSDFLSCASYDELPQSELAKLWKGIFYCYWMSDKPLVQQALASELAQLVLTISSVSSSLYFLQGFWSAITREWNGIDRFRMDKYYSLVRKFINASFQLLVREKWEADVCSSYNAILTSSGGPLSPNGNRVPSSLIYHLVDIYLEELDKVIALHHPVLPAPLLVLISPFYELAARCSSAITQQRIETALILPLFRSLTRPCTDNSVRSQLLYPSHEAIVENSCISSPETEGIVSPTAIKQALLTRMFDIASHPDSKDGNRRRLYTIWKNIKAEEEGPAVNVVFD